MKLKHSIVEQKLSRATSMIYSFAIKYLKSWTNIIHFQGFRNFYRKKNKINVKRKV